MKDSYTLLKKNVLDIGLKSSSEVGGKTLGIEIWDSVTHCLGYSEDDVILLKILEIGSASSGENSCTIFLGTSP